MIDWNNPKCKISKFFTVEEATYLPSIKTFHLPSDKEKENILALAEKMDKVREFLGKGIIVHCWIRPTSVRCIDTKYMNFDYNKHVGSTAKSSPHIQGNAIDFHVSGYETNYECDYIRGLLLPRLEEWDMRMENINGGWIHMDVSPVISSRFFKP
jgi:hypothetical protein